LVGFFYSFAILFLFFSVGIEQQWSSATTLFKLARHFALFWRLSIHDLHAQQFYISHVARSLIQKLQLASSYSLVAYAPQFHGHYYWHLN
jgi:hypothetical protein